MARMACVGKAMLEILPPPETGGLPVLAYHVQKRVPPPAHCRCLVRAMHAAASRVISSGDLLGGVDINRVHGCAG
jgi:hypothetical protein